jgi:16S rRNA A1518/A1519 N6-dimethyltransferase RsmA/KsgA/DIM1 with predicted DNA glycosylase/AP lyase activity
VLYIVVSIIILFFGIGAWRGAPYLPILDKQGESLLDFSEIKKGQRLIDLGSGDGKLLKLAAKRGVSSVGYEINPLLYVVSKIYTYKYRHLITIHLADFWFVDLPETDLIAVFLIDRYMERLDNKLSKQLTSPTKLVSYVYSIPNKIPDKTNKNSYLYNYKNSDKS